MVLDPNWGTNLFRTYQDARRSRLQEQEAADEAVTRGLQRQQMQAGMARQVKQDAAMEDVAAEYERQAAQPAPAAPQLDPSIPAAPIAPPRPTKTPPDALSAGGIPGVKLQPSLKGRPGVREAIQPAMEDAIVKKAGRDPSFFAKLIPTAPLMAPSLKAKLVRAGMLQDVLRVDMQDRERAMKAPLEAFNLQRDVEKDDLSAESTRHTMKHQDDTAAVTKAHYGAIESSNNRDFELRKAKQAYEQDPARFSEQLFRDAAQAGYKVAQENKRGEWRGIVEDKREQGRNTRAENANKTRASIASGGWKAAGERNAAKIASNEKIAAENLAQKYGEQNVRVAIENARNDLNRARSNKYTETQMMETRRKHLDMLYRNGVDTSDADEILGLAESPAGWFSKGSVEVKPGAWGPAPIGMDVGRIAPIGGKAALDDIKAEKARRAAARAAAKGAPIQ